MFTSQPVHIASITAATDVEQKYFVGYNGGICALDAKAFGVSHVNTSAGEQLPVMVEGIAIVRSGGVIDIGDAVKSDNNGKAITVTTGVPPEMINGYALTATTGADEMLKVKLV